MPKAPHPAHLRTVSDNSHPNDPAAAPLGTDDEAGGAPTVTVRVVRRTNRGPRRVSHAPPLFPGRCLSFSPSASLSS